MKLNCSSRTKLVKSASSGKTCILHPVCNKLFLFLFPIDFSFFKRSLYLRRLSRFHNGSFEHELCVDSRNVSFVLITINNARCNAWPPVNKAPATCATVYCPNAGTLTIYVTSNEVFNNREPSLIESRLTENNKEMGAAVSFIVNYYH